MFVNPHVFGSLFRDMSDFRNEVDRVFGRNNRQATAVTPAINVWEDESAYYAEADLPDVAADKLDIFVKEGNHLTIQGERATSEPKNAVWHRQERFAGKFSRELVLPLPVDADKVEASFEHGVLKLKLPKSEAAKPRKITVKTV